MPSFAILRGDALVIEGTGEVCCGGDALAAQ
jgi:hypothetical protein